MVKCFLRAPSFRAAHMRGVKRTGGERTQIPKGNPPIAQCPKGHQPMPMPPSRHMSPTHRKPGRPCPPVPGIGHASPFLRCAFYAHTSSTGNVLVLLHKIPCGEKIAQGARERRHMRSPPRTPCREGFPDAMASVFPDTEVQLRVVHQIRNSVKYVASKDRKGFMRDLKLVYQAVSEEAAGNSLGRSGGQVGRAVSHRDQELARQLGEADGLFPALTSHKAYNLHHKRRGRLSPPSEEGDKKQGRARV